MAADLEHDHLILIPHPIHQPQGLIARDLESRRFFIRALHGGRGVQEHDLEAAGFGVGWEVGPTKGEHRQAEHEELENQKPIAAESLERRVRLGFRKEFLPEQGAGDPANHPLAFEQIEQDDHRDGGGKSKGA